MGSGADKEWMECSECGAQFLELNVTHTCNKVTSDGSTASYYELPRNASELQDLISHRNMNAQVGEIFRECYRYGKASHSDEIRGIKKIIFYATAELKRLQKLKGNHGTNS